LSTAVLARDLPNIPVLQRFVVRCSDDSCARSRGFAVIRAER